MKNIWKLSDYLFFWYWKKWEKYIWIASLILAAITLFYVGMIHVDANVSEYEYFPKCFQTYDMVVDYSFLPIIFILGLLLIFATLFLQIKGFFNHGKGAYTLFTLPMKRKEVYYAFALCSIAAIVIYYILWLVLLVLAYFPITMVYEHQAAKEIFYLSEGHTLTNMDTHLYNGLFLAFRRSWFLSTFFPSSLWHVPAFVAGLLLLWTAILFGAFYTKSTAACIVVSILSIAGGVYLILSACIHRYISSSNGLFLGKNIVISVVAAFMMLLIQSCVLRTLEEQVEGSEG